MRSLLFLCILSLVLAGCGTPTPQIDSPKTFDKDGLSFSYPQNWQVEEDVTEDVRLLYVDDPKDINSLATITIFSETGMPLEEYVELTKMESMDNITVVSRKVEPFTRTVDGKSFEGFAAKIDALDNGIKVDLRREFFLVGKIYFSALLDVEDQKKVQPAFDLILGSLELEAPK